MKILAALRVSALSLSLAVPVPAQSTALLERREVRVDGHPISVWSKRPPTEARGSILLVHGRTWSARPNFDLRAPGASLMDALVAEGYAAYAVDLRGYGGTPRDSSGWLTPDRAARDVSAVLEWVRAREVSGRASRGGGRAAAPRPVLLGYSQGAMVAVLVAQRHPEQLSGLVLFGYPFPGADALRSAPADPVAPERRRTTAAAAGEDFISPAVTPPGVKEAYVRTATTTDSIRADWRLQSQFAEIDPTRVRVPTLLLDGERDPYAIAANHPAFFARLATADRWWVVLPGVDHAAHLETRRAFVSAVLSFIERR